MEKQFNFTTKLVDANNSWGMKVNGNWVGLIGQVYNGVSLILLFLLFFFNKINFCLNLDI